MRKLILGFFVLFVIATGSGCYALNQIVVDEVPDPVPAPSGGDCVTITAVDSGTPVGEYMVCFDGMIGDPYMYSYQKIWGKDVDCLAIEVEDCISIVESKPGAGIDGCRVTFCEVAPGGDKFFFAVDGYHLPNGAAMITITACEGIGSLPGPACHDQGAGG